MAGEGGNKVKEQNYMQKSNGQCQAEVGYYIQSFGGFFTGPFRASLSNLLLRLCTEATRETFCFPGPFLTCD